MVSDFEGLIVEDVDRWDDKDLVNLRVDLEINMIGKYFKVPRLVFLGILMVTRSTYGVLCGNH